MADDVELLPPIERDEAMDRTYIPLPGGWEVQTKGKGSTFRICEPGDDPMRLGVPASPYLHDTLARMARDIHASVANFTAAQAAENERLRVEVRNLRDDAHRRSSEIAALGDAVQHWMKRAERLAEAGRRVTAAFRALGDSSCITAAAIKRRECEAAMLAFDALLRDQTNN